MSVTYYHRMIRDILVRLIIYCSPSAGVLHMPAVMHVTPIQLLFTVMNFALFLGGIHHAVLIATPEPLGHWLKKSTVFVKYSRFFYIDYYYVANIISLL